MATSKEKVIRIAVIGVSGLEGSSKGGQPNGVGKSALCNRFIRPLADEYKPDIHKSVVSKYDFKDHVINNDHFLYWGEVTKPLPDHGNIKFSVIEHTEFLDDRSFSTLEGSDKHPYFKRCMVTKLTSPEKLMYIDSYHQLGEEDGYVRKAFPKGKFIVDGFLMVFDVNSTKQGRPLTSQLEFLEKLYKFISKSKKPVVIAATKCDDADDHYLDEARKFATQCNTYFIETSAHKALNVDLAFITLAQMVDKTKGTPKVVLYTDAFREQREILERIIDGYETLLETDVTTYHTLWHTKSKEYQKKDQNFIAYVKRMGTANAKKLFEKRRRTLKEELIERRKEVFLSTLLKCLERIFPDVSYMGESWEACRGIMTEHDEFDQWFVVTGEEWQSSQYLETDDIRIPYDFLDTNDEECLKVFEGYVMKFMEEDRAGENTDGDE